MRVLWRLHQDRSQAGLAWQTWGTWDWTCWGGAAQALALSVLTLLCWSLWAGVRAWPQWQAIQALEAQTLALRPAQLAIPHTSATNATNTNATNTTSTSAPEASLPAAVACVQAAHCLAQVTALAARQGLSVHAAQSEPVPHTSPSSAGLGEAGLSLGPVLTLDLQHGHAGEARFWRFMQALQQLPFSLELQYLSLALQTAAPTEARRDPQALAALPHTAQAVTLSARLRLQVLAAKPGPGKVVKSTAAQSNGQPNLGPMLLAPNPSWLARVDQSQTNQGAMSMEKQPGAIWQWLGKVAWQQSEQVLLRRQTPQGTQLVLVPLQATDYTVHEQLQLRVFMLTPQRLRLEIAGQGSKVLERVS